MAEQEIEHPERATTSRRAVLAGIGGAVAAAGAGLVTGRPAEAANGDALVLGQTSSANARTSLVASVPGTGEAALQVENPGSSGSAIVATGSGVGVRATGGHGVIGSSHYVLGAGLLGEDLSGNVFGRGVIGVSQNGWGVVAISGGQALRVEGRAVFKDRSGIATIAYPTNKVTVTVGGPPLTALVAGPPSTPASTVLAVLQTSLAGVWVRAAVPVHGTNTFTIHLNKAPGSAASPKSVTVAWFVVN